MASKTRSVGMASRISLRLIGAYQRWISPYKGYRCAYSVVHGGTGCSGFAKSAIRAHGIRGALSPIRQRFRDCHAAMISLNAAKPPQSRPRRRDGSARFCAWGEAGICGAEGCCALTGEVTKAKAGICGAIGAFGPLGCCGS